MIESPILRVSAFRVRRVEPRSLTRYTSAEPMLTMMTSNKITTSDFSHIKPRRPVGLNTPAEYQKTPPGTP